ncbi:MAG: hypothetical protein PHH68_00760 [Candidatus Omnitrophica bacterium]|nr:hypothetical protein [Candidatus Omnitrophota bacterium]MDD5078839.1 hypothetical protein [Candidatus Omnitrophota bacterium]
MRYLNAALTIIAVFLVVIAGRLFQLGILMEGSRESSQSFINSCQALINSNQHLESEIINLRKQIAGLQEQVLKR